MLGIVIGLPFGGRLVHPKWAVSLKTLDFPVNTTQAVVMVEGREITEARNMIVKAALDQDTKYIFFLDDDVVIPRQTIQALGYVLENGIDDNVMVATGIYCTKTKFPSPVIFRDEKQGSFWDWRVNDIFDIDSAGAGCMMINTEVFKHLEEPYFRTTQEYKNDFTGTPALHVVSEDLYFCRSVRAAGFKIKAHGAIICPHFDNKTHQFYTLPEDSLPYKREAARQQEEITKESSNG